MAETEDIQVGGPIRLTFGLLKIIRRTDGTICGAGSLGLSVRGGPPHQDIPSCSHGSHGAQRPCLQTHPR
jgi:hypothetical protein